MPGGLFKLLKHNFSDIATFGPHGTGGGGAWRRRLVYVWATPARGRNVEANVPPTLAFFSRVMLGSAWTEKCIIEKRLEKKVKSGSKIYVSKVYALQHRICLQFLLLVRTRKSFFTGDGKP